jgi:hypothetical protein
VGTVYQFVGVILFIASMLVCCGSSLVSKDVAERRDLMEVGWVMGPVHYSAQRAVTVSLLMAVFCGLALAGIGLGLQAQRRAAPYGASAVTGFAAVFWVAQALFFGLELRSAALSIVCGALAAVFGILAGFGIVSLREMRRDPPADGHEVLPADYKVPYSHLHQDPPEVRLARELEQRRERLAVQQKELEMLEARLKRKLEATQDATPPPQPPRATNERP